MLAEVKSSVTTLRQIEREAADRLSGLDTRTYEWLLVQARAAEAAIAVPALLKAEEELARCRNLIRPVRRDCALGAAALVRVIAELVAGEASRDAKAGYGKSMAPCEFWSGFAPLDTALRAAK
jgi:hypothetical protein